MPQRWCADDADESPKRPISGVRHDRLCDVVGRIHLFEARKLAILAATIRLKPVNVTAQSHAHERLIDFYQDRELSWALFAVYALAYRRTDKLITALKDFDFLRGKDAQRLVDGVREFARVEDDARLLIVEGDRGTRSLFWLA